ncbi:MAG: phage holin family protein [bacterium]|nr:phage holin family protein [Myxococcales bacterium]
MNPPIAPKSDREKSIGTLLAELADETGTLVKQEIALAKAEINERLDQAKRGAIALAIGALVAYAGLIVLLFAAVFSLGMVLQMWIAALAVGGGVLLIGLVMLLKGIRDLGRGTDLAPRRAKQEAEATINMIKEQIG